MFVLFGTTLLCFPVGTDNLDSNIFESSTLTTGTFFVVFYFVFVFCSVLFRFVFQASLKFSILLSPPPQLWDLQVCAITVATQYITDKVYKKAYVG